MHSLISLLGLLSLAVSAASATALTYKVGANEKACFFSSVEKPDSKIAFYFAVRYADHSVNKLASTDELIYRFNPEVLSMSIIK